LNVLLWVIQALLAGLYAIAGFTKIFMFDRFAGQLASTNAFPQGVWVVIGAFELVCSVGLILPAITRTRLPLTAIAAGGLAVEGLLFGVFHAVYREQSPMVFTLVLAALAAFVAYGRFAAKPY
jgi:uncharacterized membrane protein YphA (DoxX/SURF4 family)